MFIVERQYLTSMPYICVYMCVDQSTLRPEPPRDEVGQDEGRKVELDPFLEINFSDRRRPPELLTDNDFRS